MKDDPPSRAGPSRPRSGILGCIVNVRPYKPEDTATLARLFTETVHSVNAADYSRAQLAAWAPDPPDMEHWRRRFSERIAFVAEHDSEIVGFRMIASQRIKHRGISFINYRMEKSL